MSQTLLVTGSHGLIGSEAVVYFSQQGFRCIGLDNNMRQNFFGPGGDTRPTRDWLEQTVKGYTYYDMDIRDRAGIFRIFKEHQLDGVIHCAAQPSHDYAGKIPLDDFDINAVGTLNLLEAMRQANPDGVFIFMSTNKVYGDQPNYLKLVEHKTRWDYADEKYYHGIDETCSVDQCLHSIFGASKVAADVIAQEYGRYFGMKVGIFRGGCLTGPQHAGVELHGFLSYLVKVTVKGGVYKVFGYKGKQVRDQIHSYDVVSAFHEFYKNPKCGEVYNLGGGRENSVSILESFAILEKKLGGKVKYEYVDQARKGDHICYISDLRKMKRHFPNWRITKDLDTIFDEIIEGCTMSRKT